MPNHNRSNDIIVVNGTAPLEDLSQMKKFKIKPVLKKSFVIEILINTYYHSSYLPKNNSRIKGSCKKCSTLPLSSLHGLVQSRCIVSSNGAHKNVHKDA